MNRHHEHADEPLEVEAIDGEVVVTAPDGATLALTAEAAITSAKRLLRAAGESPETYQKPLG